MRSYVAPWGGALAMALLLQMPAHADDAIESRYQRDVTACHAGQSGQSLQDCLREAGAVRQSAQSGNNGQGQALSEDYQRNAMQRCARLPAREQFECEALKNHPDSVQGSVRGGGTMRQLRIREVGEPQPIAPPAAPTTPTAPQAVPAPTPAPVR